MPMVKNSRLRTCVPWGHGALPVLAGMFILVRLGEFGGTLPGWARWYLDDVLCLPLVLAAVLAAHRLGGRDAGWRLPLTHGILALGLFGIYFELVLPLLRPSAVGDPLDLVMYALGLGLFQFLINRPGCGPGQSCRSSDQVKTPRPVAASL